MKKKRKEKEKEKQVATGAAGEQSSVVSEDGATTYWTTSP